MTQAPGYKKWPDHRVEEQPALGVVRAEVDGEVLAESRACVKLIEDKHPTRYYFPRSDVKLERLERSDTTTECPFKGTASYYGVRVGDEVLPDAAWTYESPFDEHVRIKDHIVFYTERFPELSVTAEDES